MKKVFLISLQEYVEVIREFTTTINGYESPAYIIKLPDDSVRTVVKAQIID